MGYLKKSLVSVSWVSALRIANRIFSFVRMAILARLLSPAQFGDFGVAALILALVEIFTETGINVFLVQQNEEDSIKKYANTAWIISIFRGLLIALIVVTVSSPVSDFFNNPASRSLILLMALVPLIRGFINPAVASFQQHLAFNKEFTFRFTVSLIDAIVTIAVALLYKHPSSLVYGLIAGTCSEVLLSHLWIKPRPLLHFNLDQAKQIIHQGKWVTGAGIAAYFANKGIDMSIGKFISTQSLGIYQMGYKFSQLFVDELVEMVNRVAFPVYTKIGGDKRRLLTAFLKTYIGFVVIVIPLMILVNITAPLIVSVVLGPNWIAAIPVIRALTYFGISTAFLTPTNPLFLAVKRQNYLTLAVVFQCIVLFIGLTYVYITGIDLERVIIATTVAQALTVPLRNFLAYRIFTS